MTTTVHTTEIGTGRRLFGAETNPYYADEAKRRVQGRVEVDATGQHLATIWHGREYQPGKYAWDGALAISPLFTNPDLAYAWLMAAYEWAVNTCHGQLGRIDVDRAGYVFEGSAPSGSPGLCRECDRYATLTVTHEAYGDRVTCTNCTHETWNSIGD